MKNIWILTTLMVASLTAITQTNWYPQNSGTNTVLFDVHFIDQYKGWTCGNTGLVMRTEDGGANWIELDAPPNNTYYGIHFVNDLNGWAVGFGGKIIHTSDGGDTWNEQESGFTTYLYDVYFLNEDTGWIVGGDNGTFPSFNSHRYILHTIDGGQNWFPQVAESDESPLREIQFADQYNGYAVSESGSVLHTTNGGSTWIEIVVHQSYQFTGVSVVSTTTAYIVGEYLGLPHVPGIFKTTDSGETWSEQTFSEDFSLIAIHFADEDHGWAVGGATNLGAMLSTSDGGQTWNYEDPGTDNFLFKVFFVDAQTGWAVGMNGTVISTILFTGIEDILDKESLAVYPNPATDRVNISLDIKESAPVSIILVNSLGQVVYHQEESLYPGNTVYAIDTEKLPAGYYFATVENGAERITRKLIIR